MFTKKNMYDVLMLVVAIVLVFPLTQRVVVAVMGSAGKNIATPVAVVAALVSLKVMSDLVNQLVAEGKL